MLIIMRNTWKFKEAFIMGINIGRTKDKLVLGADKKDYY